MATGTIRTRRSKKEIIKNASTMERLSMKFPDKCVKTRQIVEMNHEVKELSYLPGDKIIERLNECFNGVWSFTIQDKIIDVDIGHISILGRLEVTIDGRTVVKEQWGSGIIGTFSNGKVINLGNDVKAATTDSLKKCATLLGVGLYLYADDDERAPATANYVPPNTPKTEAKVEELREEISDENKKATKAQTSSIMKIARDNNVDVALILAKYGVDKVSSMKRADAANFIINYPNIIASMSQSQDGTAEAPAPTESGDAPVEEKEEQQ